MTTPAWFEARSAREKRLLLVMAALMVVTIVWAGVIRPVRDGLSSSAARHADAVVRLGETEAAVAAIRRGGQPPALGASLSDAVRARADQAGFTLTNLAEEAPGRIRVQIPSARAGALTRWLARLEAGGIVVQQATLTDNGDRTVGAMLVLSARSS